MIVTTLPIGAELTPKPDRLDSFRAEYKRKIAGRTAVVVGHTYPNRNPILVFPAIGRKRECKFGGNYRLLELQQFFDIKGEIVQMEVGK